MSKKSINQVVQRELTTANDRRMFSIIKNLVEEVKFGTLELRLTVKNGEVSTIKNKSEKSFNLHND